MKYLILIVMILALVSGCKDSNEGTDLLPIDGQADDASPDTAISSNEVIMQNEFLSDYLTEYHKILDAEDVSDAMFMARMQDAVTEFNQSHGTSHDPYESVMEYIHENFDKEGELVNE